MSRTRNGWLGALILALIPAGAAAQSAEMLHACYVPATGTVYRIATAGLPDNCTGPRAGPNQHVRFSWTDGAGAVLAGDAAGGDLSGAFPDPTVVALLGRALAATPPTAGQVLAWDAAEGAWAPVTPEAGVTEHGALTGLDGDDHTQYLLTQGVRQSRGFAVAAEMIGIGAPAGGIPLEGPGVRFMWYPGKWAFRAGWAQNNEWDNASVGQGSFAFGLASKASGNSSAAWGAHTEATGSFSTAWGASTVASGSRSTAFGEFTEAASRASLAIGRYNVSTGHAQLWNDDDPLFMAGNGTNSSNRSNALTLYKSGNLTIAGALTATGVEFPDGTIQTTAASVGVSSHADLDDLDGDDHAQYLLTNGVRMATHGFAVRGQLGVGTIPTFGGGVRLMWYPGKAALRAGDATSGSWDDAHIGESSAAFGRGTIASGNYTTAFGSGAMATGNAATAWGSTSVASGVLSTAFGLATRASSHSSVAIGRFNESTGSPDAWNAADPLFMAGNGTSDGTRSNALTLYKSGDLTIAGALTATGVHFPDGSVQTTAAVGGGVASHADLDDLDGDDHAQYLLTDGVRSATDGFAVTGALDAGTIPVSGAGVRLMWYPGKAAFRAGVAAADRWDDANVGSRSAAFGDATRASGIASMAWGLTSQATGTLATAFGRDANASGAQATAWGFRSTASAPHATAFGELTVASGPYATAFGENTTASAPWATAWGRNATATAAGATASGIQTTASGGYATAMGVFTEAAAYASVAIGRFNDATGSASSWVDTDPLFVAGNGTNSSDRSNALTLLKNGDLSVTGAFTAGGEYGVGAIPASGAGVRLMWYPGKAAFRAGTAVSDRWDDANVGIRSAAFGDATRASGPASTAWGAAGEATGPVATAFGRQSSASGAESTAWGLRTTASAHQATAFGELTVASGRHATAFGERATASAPWSTAWGRNTTASGGYATAMGLFTEAAALASVAMGQFNVVAGSASSWVATDPLLVVGNGSDPGNRSNALTLLKNGDLVIAGTLTQSSDIRLKLDLEPLDDVMARVRSLTPIAYRFAPGTGRPAERKVGLSAQEVQAAFPELVSVGPDGYLTVAYGELSAVLVRAVQEQQDRIDGQDRRIAELEDRLARIEALLAGSR